jgi:glycosyltransferase involved in cell wall biosynthesis
VDRVIVINEELKDYAVKMGADSSKVAVIRAGIDLARYNPDISGREVRKELRISDDDLVLFFMGWLYEFSGLKEVANDVLKSGNPRLRFLVVGDGDAFEDLKRISMKSDCKGSIILTGKQPFERIPELIASANICLLPAYNNETMRDIVPIKLYEYMAMGKPVISTDLPGVRKEFGEGHGVSYVEGPEEVVRLAIQMSESNALEEAGQRARRFVEGNSWEKVVDDFEKNLKDLSRNVTQS